MFLGTHSPRLDDKGRLFLPAKFRDRMSDGLVVTRGQERCLYVFPMDEFLKVTQQMQAAPTTSKAVRDFTRVFLSGASDEVPDKQGRVTIPATLRAYAGLTRECTVIGAGSRVEVWDTDRLERLPRVHRAGLLRPVRGGHPRTPLTVPCPFTQALCAPGARSPAASLPGTTSPVPGRIPWSGWRPDRRATSPAPPQHQHAPHAPHQPHHRSTTHRPQEMSMNARGMAADRHVPVLRDRIVELLAPALDGPGSVYLDGTLGMGGHAEAILERCPTRARRGHRPRPGGARARSRAAGAVCRARHLRARRLRRGPAGPGRGGRGPRGCRALRPRGLLAPARRGRPRLLRTARTRRWTCGWTSPPGSPQPRCSTPTTRATSRRCCATSARSGSPARSSGRSSASARPSRSPPPAGWSTCSRRWSRPRRRRAAATRASAPSRPCASRSTPSCRSGRRRCRARSTRCPSAGASPSLSYHSLEDRITKRVLTAGAKGSSPEGLPVELPEHAAYLRLLTRGAEEASPEEQASNPRSASVRLRAAERTRPTPATATNPSTTKGTHR